MAGKSYTGVIVMLAGAEIERLTQRQHIRAPDSTTAEIMAAGTALHHVYPIRGLLQELLIPQTWPTTIYCDSQSTIFVAHDGSAVKRSVWVLRRTAVLREAVDMQDFIFRKVSDDDNCADGATKPIPHQKHVRCLSHTHQHASQAVPPPPSPPPSPP